jgi:deoxyribonuclease-4
MGELLIGAHMSFSGGIHLAIERGEATGCRTIQIFLKNRNRWAAKPLSAADCRLFREAKQRSGINPVVAHDSYLINPASPDSDLYERSTRA